MKWADANLEIFQEHLVEGNEDGARAAIADAKAYGLNTSDMEHALQSFINDEKMQ